MVNECGCLYNLRMAHSTAIWSLCKRTSILFYDLSQLFFPYMWYISASEWYRATTNKPSISVVRSKSSRSKKLQSIQLTTECLTHFFECFQLKQVLILSPPFWRYMRLPGIVKNPPASATAHQPRQLDVHMGHFKYEIWSCGSIIPHTPESTMGALLSYDAIEP